MAVIGALRINPDNYRIIFGSAKDNIQFATQRQNNEYLEALVDNSAWYFSLRLMKSSGCEKHLGPLLNFFDTNPIAYLSMPLFKISHNSIV